MSAQLESLQPNLEAASILVVDDNPGDRLLATRYLNKSNRYVFGVVEAASGTKALEIVSSQVIDCVLLDYYLPDSEGVNLINALRVAAQDPELPIVLLTGKGDESTAVSAMQHGASDYLPKNKANAAVLTRAIGNALEKARLQRLVARKRELLDVSNRELKQRNSEIREFYQTVSHELKTPVTAIREYNSLLLEGVCGEVSSQQVDFLKRSVACCDRLTRMINDLLDAARIETSKMQVEFDFADPNALLQECVDSLQRRAAEGGLILDCVIESPLPCIEIDADRITQVVSNLITNAIKHTPSGGEVIVQAEYSRESPGIDVMVIDTGSGIPAEHLESIFERYVQVKSHPDDFVDGLGIGLYLCRALAALHGGYINVKSELGKGSTFTLHIPENASTACGR